MRNENNNRPKVCYFCKNKSDEIDFRNESMLKRYINYNGRIQPKSKTGNCTKHQRKITKAIKTARQMGVIK
jgi:small subunit ribosomal protein S18